MGAMPVEGAHLVGTCLSVMIFGLYTCLFTQTIYRLKQASFHSVLLFIQLSLIWLFVLMTTIFQTTCTYTAFIASSTGKTAHAYYAQWYLQWQTLVIGIFTCIVGLLAGIFICWRLYVMYKQSWKILVVPGLLLLGQGVCSTVATIYAFKIRTDKRYVVVRSQWHLGLVVLGLTMNGLVMTLMCWKIWRFTRSVSRNPISDGFYHHALQVLIESGAFMAIVSISSIILKSADLLVGNIIIMYIKPQVVGLVPTLIVLRVLTSTRRSEGATGRDTLPPTSQHWSVSRPVFARMTRDSAATHISDTGYLRPITTVEDKTQLGTLEEGEDQSDSLTKGSNSDMDVTKPRSS
ncbi:hypothetical protein FRC03_009054 [Tulasnella sp. 419]|nr:hypothetical protein FRC02_003856 [Tulasnella sp. 418]KAG8958504.1 hypothetical protein FRC03_009054 [Tulasnella sp. 419]